MHQYGIQQNVLWLQQYSLLCLAKWLALVGCDWTTISYSLGVGEDDLSLQHSTIKFWWVHAPKIWIFTEIECYWIRRGKKCTQCLLIWVWQQSPAVWDNGSTIQDCDIENGVFGGLTTCYFDKTKMDAFHNTTINHPASSCHWIMYEGVFALDTTIFDGRHNNQHSWVSHVLGKILKHKMMISREGERCRRHPKMFWDHTMVMKRESSVGTERGCLFLLLVPDLVFRQTIHVKCDSGRYLSNQSSNDEARTCPKLAMT